MIFQRRNYFKIKIKILNYKNGTTKRRNNCFKRKHWSRQPSKQRRIRKTGLTFKSQGWSLRNEEKASEKQRRNGRIELGFLILKE